MSSSTQEKEEKEDDQKIEKQSDPKVCIIGAGLAGLRAARYFQENGISYTILEGSDRIGGRVFPFEYENGYLQHGAEYVNGFENEIYDIVEKFNLLDKTKSRTKDLYILDEGTKTYLDGAPVEKQILEVWNEFIGSLDNILDEESWDYDLVPSSVPNIGERVDFHFSEFLKIIPISERPIYKNLRNLYINYFQTEWSSPINELSMANISKWDDGTDIDDSAVLDKFGFSRILKEFENQIPKENIRLNSKVLNINYEGPKIRIRLSSGPDQHYDHCIVTSSLGYLKLHHRTMFSPSLTPHKISAIRDMGFGNNMKIFIEFERPWWTEESTILITTSESENSRFSDNLSVFQPSNWAQNILVAWIAGDGPFEVGIMKDQEIIEKIRERLQKNGIEMTKIKRIYRHCWSLDEFSCGSYSYLTSESIENHTDVIDQLAEPIYREDRPIICFAGEHTSQLLYQTTTGAAQTGLREAKRIAHFYNKHICD